MLIIKIPISDITLVEVKTTNECKPTPHCKKHGAMNKVSITESGGGYWRCVSVENCKAGCEEIRISWIKKVLSYFMK